MDIEQINQTLTKILKKENKPIIFVLFRNIFQRLKFIMAIL